jgi:uncharacterized protein (DUF1778 family)
MTRRSYQIKAEQARNERWKTISVRLTASEYAEVAKTAALEGQSVAGLAREVIRQAAGLKQD